MQDSEIGCILSSGAQDFCANKLSCEKLDESTVVQSHFSVSQSLDNTIVWGLRNSYKNTKTLKKYQLDNGNSTSRKIYQNLTIYFEIY